MIAGRGIETATSTNGRTAVTGSRIACTDANCFGIAADGVTSLLVADDVIHVTGAAGDAALIAGGGTETMTLDSSTLIGDGGTSAGALVLQSFPGNEQLNVDDTIIRGFGSDLKAFGGSAGSLATISIRYSDFDRSKEIASPSDTATITEPQPTTDLNNVDPRLAPDFSLEAGSPAIDAGDPAAPPAGEPTADLAGHPRKVDGDHNGTATIDMGAFEFQPPNHAPIASFSAPAKAKPRAERPTFNGAASRDPDHDPITFAWRFGDERHLNRRVAHPRLQEGRQVQSHADGDRRLRCHRHDVEDDHRRQDRSRAWCRSSGARR